MIAASILTSRALAPVEIAIANWRGFLAARQSAHRLVTLLAAAPQITTTIELPSPRKALDVKGLWVAAPGQQKPIVQNTAFSLAAGGGLGIIGPAASGKSTLARALVGVWLPLRGSVRLDGAALDQWTPSALGSHIGYLPQDVELFDSTVADNIARFDPDASSETIIAAARAADVHDLIVALPEGYGTRVGEAGCALSAGQRQRIALARALYGDPFLVVLDEPNANLDMEGDKALTSAITRIRARGGIAIVIAHRPSALAAVDQLLVMGNGVVQAFGPKDEVLRRVSASAPQTPHLKVIAEPN
jgi:ATP-binding cassette, subfamily C, type I secretion system permease/ATPase